MSLTAKINESTDRIAIIPHRGVNLYYYRNLNTLSYGSRHNPKNGAVWVDFHKAAKSLGLTRTWIDRNLNAWTV